MNKRFLAIMIVRFVAYTVLAVASVSLFCQFTFAKLAVSAALVGLVCLIDKRNDWGLWTRERYKYTDYIKGE